MTQIATAPSATSVYGLVERILALNLVPALDEVRIDRNEFDGDNHLTLVGNGVRIHLRKDGQRIAVSFYGHRSGEFNGRHQNVYWRDLVTRDEFETMTTSATVAFDTTPQRLATAIKKVLPSAQRAFALLDEWEARQQAHEDQRTTAMALINATLGTDLKASRYTENSSAYFREGSPLARLFGPYCRIVVDGSGHVQLEGARLNFAGTDLQRVLDALTTAATTIVDGLTTTDRG